jgi:archaellum biogenesis ATPase FlaH
VDIEKAFVPHFTKLESLKVIWDKGVRSEHFFDEGVRELFEYSLEYYIKSEFKNTITQEFLEGKFSDYFVKNTWPEGEYLVIVLIEELLTKYRKTTTQNVLLKAAHELDTDPEAGITLALTNLTKIQSDTSTRERIEIYGEGYERRTNEYVDNQLNNNKTKKGIYLGWDELNNHTYGIQKGELAVVVGIPNVGKSWVGSHIALEAAKRKNKVYFASLELRKELTLMRLDCLASGVPYSRYERGELTPAELKRLKEAREEIMEYGEYLLIDSPSRKSERTVLELYSKAKHWGADLIVGDQLSWLTTEKNYGTVSNFQTLQMAEVITDVASINREMGMASVWLAQFNREAMKGKKKRGDLGQIGLSSQIEQIVDWAFGIGCTKEMKTQEALILDIMKSRRSDLKSWMMSFELKDQTKLEIVRTFEEDE